MIQLDSTSQDQREPIKMSLLFPVRTVNVLVWSLAIVHKLVARSLFVVFWQASTMAIYARCSACACAHTLEDRFLDKMIKCKQCGQPFRVQAASTEGLAAGKPQAKGKPPTPEREAIQPPSRPVPSRARVADDISAQPPMRRRVVDEDDDDERGPRRRRDRNEKSSLGLILGLVGGGVVVLGGVIGLVAYLMMRSADVQPNPAFAQNNAPVGQPNGQPPPNIPNPPQANPPQPAPFVPPNFDPPKNDPAPQKQPRTKQPKAKQPKAEAPKIEPVALAATRVGEWRAAPDPGPDVNKAPSDVALKAVLNLTGNPQIVFPSTPSAFVAVRHGPFTKEIWQVLDLQTGAVPGAIAGKIPDFRDEALSPDGKFLSGRGRGAQFGTTAINTWSFAAKKFLTPIVVANSFVKNHDFVEGNSIISMVHAGGDTLYEVWSPANGQPLGQFQRKGHPDFRHAAAFSPGRKYLAIFEGGFGQDHKLVILHAVKGEVVGEVAFPKDYGTIKAIAFSPDGVEVACYFEHFSQGRLTSWKMDKGEQGVDHSFAQSVSSLDQKTFFHKGPIMEWVPDKSGWLLYGQFWIDYPTGALVHSFPTVEDLRRQPHQFVGKDHRVNISAAPGQNGKLWIAALPADVIAAKVKTARAGGGSGPAPLPEAKEGDVAAAKNLDLPGGAVAWSVQPDPAPAGKALPPLTLRTTLAETAQVIFADNGQAVVLASIVTNALAKNRFLRADRYDVAAGKMVGETALFPAVDAGNQPRVVMPGSAPPVYAAAEVSPDGSVLAVRAHKDDPALHFWNLQDGKRLSGWIPYDDDKVEWFRFIDAQRVLTMSGKGKLALWQVADGKALYVGNGYRGTPELSGGRKFVAVLGPTALEILDTASGARRGLLAAPDGGIQSCAALAFSHDGKALAAIIFNAKGTQIARWSLANGAADGLMVAPVAAAPLQWCGPKHVLANAHLFDLDFKNAIAFYGLPGKGKPVGASPDGRFWFTSESGKDKTLLAAFTVPDPQAADISAQAAAGKVAPLIPPGSAVRVNVSSNNERFRASVEQSLNNRLVAMGYKIGAGGVTVSVNTNVGATGKVIEYEVRKASKFGPGPPIGFGIGGDIVKVQEQQVTCQSLIVDQQGMALHKAEQIIPMPRSIRFQGNDIQTELVEAMWNQAIGWGNQAPMPTNVYRIKGDLVALPKHVQVPGGG